MTAFTMFTRAGTRDGIALYQHYCPSGIAYVSAEPSAPGDPHAVPGCGCRPREEKEGPATPVPGEEEEKEPTS